MAVPDEGDWVLEAVRVYRAEGFFAGYGDSSDEDVADLLSERHQEEWGEPLEEVEDTADLRDVVLLALDLDRTWWKDLEADVLPGNEVYVGTLSRWAEISLGDFQPERVAERWDSPQGPVSVEVSVEGVSEVLRPAIRDGWFDLGVLDGVNALLGRVGKARRFVTLETGDQTAFVTALTADERARIERGRGLRFGR